MVFDRKRFMDAVSKRKEEIRNMSPEERRSFWDKENQAIALAMHEHRLAHETYVASYFANPLNGDNIGREPRYTG